MEIKIVLALLQPRYRLECAGQILVDQAGVVVIAPKRGLPMIVNVQDRQSPLDRRCSAGSGVPSMRPLRLFRQPL
jgi:hypothetical protein